MRCQHWLPREVTVEERAQKFHSDDVWVVTRHHYGISALVPQTSLRVETSVVIAKCWLFSTLFSLLSQENLSQMRLTPPVFFCTRRQLPLVSSTNSLLRLFACITLNRVNALALLKKEGPFDSREQSILALN